MNRCFLRSSSFNYIDSLKKDFSNLLYAYDDKIVYKRNWTARLIKYIKALNSPYLGLFVGKVVLNVSRRNKKDWTTNTGWLGRMAYPHLLGWLGKNVNVVVVTGTNGKTTTCALMAHLLKSNSIKALECAAGCNLPQGITSSFVANSNMFGNPQIRTAVIECDEGNLYEVVSELHPSAIVVTNIFPDQTLRFGSEKKVSELISSAMEVSGDAIWCLNKKCHFYEDIRSKIKSRVIHFDVANGACVVDNDVYEITLGIPGSFNLLNAAAAIAGAKALGYDFKNIKEAMACATSPFGRMQSFSYNGVNVLLCLAKNEAGYNVLWDSIKKKPACAVLFLVMHGIHGNDPEWINCFAYEEMAKHFSHIYVAGALAEKMKKNFGQHDNVSVVNLDDVTTAIQNNMKEAFFVTDYEAMLDIQQLFARLGAIAPFWENKGV